MSMPAAWSWFIAGYSLSLLLVGWSFDYMARRTTEKSANWHRGGNFRYDKKQDAWLCPQDHWLFPTEFDPETRLMQYRADPDICNACPVKDNCTTSMSGKSVTRPTDPWPYSEAGRFHRGLACVVAAFGMVLPIICLVINHSPGDILLFTVVIVLVAVGMYPLLRHLGNTPVAVPNENPLPSSNNTDH